MRLPRLRSTPHAALALMITLAVSACGDDAAPSRGLLTGTPTTTAGTANADTNGCVDACSEAGATRCAADLGSAETCAPDASGCLAWSTAATCGAAQRCDPDPAGAACVCDHRCAPGAASCDGTRLTTCMVDADGCGVGDQTQDCAALVSTGQCAQDACVETRAPIAPPGGSVTLEGRMRAASPLWARPGLDCAPGEAGDLFVYGAFTLVNTQDAARTLTLTPDWGPSGGGGRLYALDAPLDAAAPADGCIDASDGDALRGVRLEPGASVVIVATVEARADLDYRVDVLTEPDPPAQGCAGATVSGVVTFDDRAIDRRGLGPVTARPVEGATVVVLRGGQEIERVQTNAEGAFCARAPAVGQTVTLRVVSEDAASGPQEVVDFSGALYAVRVPSVVAGQGQTPIHIAQRDNAGAFAILNTMGRGLRFAAEAFDRGAPWPTLASHWERGNPTPFGTSYYYDEALWILGGPEDTDEYDTPVLLHELGHYIQAVYECTDDGPGSSHAGADTDPRLAWSEGWATHFANLAADSSVYLDSYGDQLALDYDMSALPAAGEYAGRPREDLTQTLSEWLIAASLWHLYQARPAEVQAPRMMAVIRDWFGPLVTDRGLPGADFVDYLDGYLCLHDGDDQARISDHLVGERTFPYDFNGACPLNKPGRPRLDRPLDLSARPKPRGQLVRDARGRLLREVTLDLVKPAPGRATP